MLLSARMSTEKVKDDIEKRTYEMVFGIEFAGPDASHRWMGPE